MVQDMSGSTLAPRCASEKGKTSTTAWMPKACAWRGTFNFLVQNRGNRESSHQKSVHQKLAWTLNRLAHFLTFKSFFLFFWPVPASSPRTVQPFNPTSPFDQPGVQLQDLVLRSLGREAPRLAGIPRLRSPVPFAAGRWADKVGEEHPGAAPPPGLLFKHGKIVDV